MNIQEKVRKIKNRSAAAQIQALYVQILVIHGQIRADVTVGGHELRWLDVIPPD